MMCTIYEQLRDCVITATTTCDLHKHWDARKAALDICTGNDIDCGIYPNLRMVLTGAVYCPAVKGDVYWSCKLDMRQAAPKICLAYAGIMPADDGEYGEQLHKEHLLDVDNCLMDEAVRVHNFLWREYVD